MVLTTPNLASLEDFEKALIILIKQAEAYRHVALSNGIEIWSSANGITVKTHDFTARIETANYKRGGPKTKVRIESASRAYGNLKDQTTAVEAFFTKLMGQTFKSISLHQPKWRAQEINQQLITELKQQRLIEANPIGGDKGEKVSNRV